MAFLWFKIKKKTFMMKAWNISTFFYKRPTFAVIQFCLSCLVFLYLQHVTAWCLTYRRHVGLFPLHPNKQSILIALVRLVIQSVNAAQIKANKFLVYNYSAINRNFHSDQYPAIGHSSFEQQRKKKSSNFIYCLAGWSCFNGEEKNKRQKQRKRKQQKAAAEGSELMWGSLSPSLNSSGSGVRNALWNWTANNEAALEGVFLISRAVFFCPEMIMAEVPCTWVQCFKLAVIQENRDSELFVLGFQNSAKMPCQDRRIPTIQQFPDISDPLVEEEHDGSIVLAHIKPIVLSGKVDKGQLGYWVKTEKCVAGVYVWTWRSRLERPAQYLGLGQAQFGCQVCPLWQGEVLGLLEALVQGLELQAGVNGAGFPDLLPFPVKPHLPVLDHSRGFLVFWREQKGKMGTGYRQDPTLQQHTRPQEDAVRFWLFHSLF